MPSRDLCSNQEEAQGCHRWGLVHRRWAFHGVEMVKDTLFLIQDQLRFLFQNNSDTLVPPIISRTAPWPLRLDFYTRSPFQLRTRIEGALKKCRADPLLCRLGSNNHRIHNHLDIEKNEQLCTSAPPGVMSMMVKRSSTWRSENGVPGNRRKSGARRKLKRNRRPGEMKSNFNGNAKNTDSYTWPHVYIYTSLYIQLHVYIYSQSLIIPWLLGRPMGQWRSRTRSFLLCKLKSSVQWTLSSGVPKKPPPQTSSTRWGLDYILTWYIFIYI